MSLQIFVAFSGARLHPDPISFTSYVYTYVCTDAYSLTANQPRRFAIMDLNPRWHTAVQANSDDGQGEERKAAAPLNRGNCPLKERELGLLANFSPTDRSIRLR
jgi:hypothetical protein